jgi:hypothetical protein
MLMSVKYHMSSLVGETELYKILWNFFFLISKILWNFNCNLISLSLVIMQMWLMFS